MCQFTITQMGDNEMMNVNGWHVIYDDDDESESVCEHITDHDESITVIDADDNMMIYEHGQ